MANVWQNCGSCNPTLVDIDGMNGSIMPARSRTTPSATFMTVPQLLFCSSSPFMRAHGFVSCIVYYIKLYSNLSLTCRSLRVSLGLMSWECSHNHHEQLTSRHWACIAMVKNLKIVSCKDRDSCSLRNRFCKISIAVPVKALRIYKQQKAETAQFMTDAIIPQDWQKTNCIWGLDGCENST